MTSNTIQTSRLRTHYVESGPDDGIPVVLIHGNLSTGRFFEHLFDGAPDRYRLIAPDMRGFGDSEPLPIDGTRGLRDWADDTQALLEALGVERPVHLAGWSTGGPAIAAFALDREVASLTFIDPVSPYGYGGTHADGTPCCPGLGRTGGGAGAPEFVRRLAAGDRSGDGAASPRTVLTTAYWSPEPPGGSRAGGDAAHRGPQVGHRRRRLPRRLHRRPSTGRASRPAPAGSSTRSRASTATGRGSSTSIPSRRSCGPTAARTSSSPTARRGRWARSARPAPSPAGPATRSFPPQPMVSQTRAVLERYRDAGGRVEIEPFEGSGHFPPIDAAERWSATFFGFLDSQ